MEQIRGCVGVIVGVDPLDAEVLACAPRLRAVSKYGVGVDNIDQQYCEGHQIPVTVTRGANTQAVADYAFSLLCCCARRIVQIHESCRAHDWKKMVGLYGKALGILGFGAIGKAVAKRASGFDMQVKAYDTFWDAAYAASHGIQRSGLEEIFKLCDFISLHLPLTADTKHIIDQDAFAKMKPSCVLINTARGELVEEQALIHALRSGRIAAAGIDVFCEEPPQNQALYTLDNLVMGSHSAASTQDASEQMGKCKEERGGTAVRYEITESEFV